MTANIIRTLADIGLKPSTTTDAYRTLNISALQRECGLQPG